MGAEIDFDPDGTGCLVEYSAMFGRTESRFLWRLVKAGRLEILADPDTAEPDEAWDSFEFAAGWFEADDGTWPVLHNASGQPGYEVAAFYTLPAPITHMPTGEEE